MRHTISVLVENKFGVLARISTLFAARGFNIDSLAVGETEDSAISRMTIVVKGDDSVLEQVTKQLNKLVDVIKVNDFNGVEYVERGLALVKINAPKAVRAEIFKMAGIFRTRVVDIAQDSLTVEVTGGEDKIEAFIEAASSYGIKEVCRTGVVALSRGNKQ
ncbi:MAG: acetolactate synthase small subunit [Endomicrobium sp.]|jgi:acetolactate synthase-1/3 small subunit|nr:acetolactate synthase small subunit [Endomicrobium sp.]